MSRGLGKAETKLEAGVILSTALLDIPFWMYLNTNFGIIVTKAADMSTPLTFKKRNAVLAFWTTTMKFRGACWSSLFISELQQAHRRWSWDVLKSNRIHPVNVSKYLRPHGTCFNKNGDEFQCFRQTQQCVIWLQLLLSTALGARCEVMESSETRTLESLPCIL